MTSPPLLTVRLRAEQDVFGLRQRGREVATEVGLEHQDQIRVATALSEVGRWLVTVGGGADVVFDVDIASQPPQLTMTLTSSNAIEPPPGPADLTVHRLVDVVKVYRNDRGGTVVMMTRRLPGRLLSRPMLQQARQRLAASTTSSPLDELAIQNEQLLAVLEEARGQRDALAVLNEELQQTNQGVLALYNQLSGELEETNRGVVALYAELDEKSAQLRAASEAKSRFMANISHELRAPVTAVIGLGRLLTDSASDPLTIEQTRQVDLIRSSASELLQLVNDLLDLAKAESGRIEPEVDRVELRLLFGQLRGTMRALTTSPGVELAIDEPDPSLVLATDPTLLAQVLRNLLHNALKFTERGVVRMTGVRDGDTVTITVTDTGIGIAPELQDRIFEEFFQISGVSAAGGTGLGLPYARRLVILLGGEMTLSSQPAVGSTFVVTLPAGPQP